MFWKPVLDHFHCLQTGGEILLVGGVACCPEESADILRFDVHGWKWEASTVVDMCDESHHVLLFPSQVLDQKLKVPRHGHVAFGFRGTEHLNPLLCGSGGGSNSDSSATAIVPSVCYVKLLGLLGICLGLCLKHT